MPKRFTLAEAQGLIPELERLLRQLVDSKSEYGEAERAFRAVAQHVMLMGGVNLKREEAVAAKNRRDAAAGRIRGSMERIQELGCIAKDLDIGLVDFPTLYRGEEVYLCWKLGEAEIEFWHGASEGFAGRKPIDRDFREHHRGDPEQ
jgi:hypothetical protein